jgi:hypothetical protein
MANLPGFFTQDAEAYPGVVYSKKHTNKTIINTIEKQSIMHNSMTVNERNKLHGAACSDD